MRDALRRLLFERASSHTSAVDVSEHTWPVAQLSVAAFAGVPRADAQCLTAARLECYLLALVWRA